MLNTKYNQIFSLIRTDREKTSFLRFLDNKSSQIFKINDTHTDENDPHSIAIKEYLAEENVDPNDKNKLEDTLRDIRNTIESIDSINITLASYPNEKILTTLSSWLEKNMEDKVILNIDIDPNIGGGAIFSNGIFKDYSLNKTIEEGFESKKAEIIALIKN